MKQLLLIICSKVLIFEVHSLMKLSSIRPEEKGLWPEVADLIIYTEFLVDAVLPHTNLSEGLNFVEQISLVIIPHES